ncbi:MAG: Zn-ribbon domain-containing OB-fold protein [Candidatus Thermoplasmatota archaeon]
MADNDDIDAPPYGPKGEHVTQSQIDEDEINYNEWDPEAQYAWSCGPAMSRFLKELKKGKLIATVCENCDRVIFPPRMFCEYCYKPVDEWKYVEDTGEIETYSISYVDPNAKPIEEPILIGVVNIDGASEGHGFMHYFDEVDPDDIEIGMKVEAVWKPEEERIGSVRDIEYFKPKED